MLSQALQSHWYVRLMGLSFLFTLARWFFTFAHQAAASIVAAVQVEKKTVNFRKKQALDIN